MAPQTTSVLKAIFFDFNGVIIDDEALQMKAYQEIFREYQIELSEQWYLDALGMDDQTFVRAIFARAQKPLDDTVLKSMLEAKGRLHRAMIEEELPLFPGVLTFLKATARNYHLGLVSMASPVEVKYVFDRARIDQLFSVIVTAENVSVCKPAPDCYRCGLGKLNEERRRHRLLPVLSSECLAIEDSPPGIKSARAVGMKTLGVTNTVSEADLRAAGADIVTPSLADWTVEAVELLY
ncbi:MAG: HAD family hydrolase [Pyrinomonadaceae bacterium]